VGDTIVWIIGWFMCAGQIVLPMLDRGPAGTPFALWVLSSLVAVCGMIGYLGTGRLWLRSTSRAASRATLRGYIFAVTLLAFWLVVGLVARGRFTA
jgi:hypothetical protein